METKKTMQSDVPSTEAVTRTRPCQNKWATVTRIARWVGGILVRQSTHVRPNNLKHMMPGAGPRL